MINRRKRIRFTIFGSIVLLIAGGILNTYAQKPLDFAGRWQTILMMNGRKEFTITIMQTGDRVTGFYPGNGTIEGTVSGRVLRFKWQTDSSTGSGRFVMDEKEHSFSGTCNRGSNPEDVDSTWSGLRLVSPEWRPGQRDPADKEPMPIPGKRTEGSPDPMGKMSEAEFQKKLAEYEAAQKNAPATFAGVWQTKSGEQIQFPDFLLQQAGDKVTGQLSANRVDLGFITEGIVDRNTLRFKILRIRSTSPFAPNLHEDYLGIGELVMGADGKSFTGTILGAATSGTLIAR